MRHHQRQGGGELHAEVAVGDAVEAVEAVAVEAQLRGGHGAVDGEGGAGQRAAAEGGDVHALGGVLYAAYVAREHHAVGQQLVGEGDGLRAL